MSIVLNSLTLLRKRHVADGLPLMGLGPQVVRIIFLVPSHRSGASQVPLGPHIKGKSASLPLPHCGRFVAVQRAIE